MPGRSALEWPLSTRVIGMWWEYLIIATVLLLGVYGFVVLIGFERQPLSRKTNRTAESMYSDYATSDRKQQKYARKRGEWKGSSQN
jgi:hypothetical protein